MPFSSSYAQALLLILVCGVWCSLDYSTHKTSILVWYQALLHWRCGDTESVEIYGRLSNSVRNDYKQIEIGRDWRGNVERESPEERDERRQKDRDQKRKKRREVKDLRK